MHSNRTQYAILAGLAAAVVTLGTAVLVTDPLSPFADRGPERPAAPIMRTIDAIPEDQDTGARPVPAPTSPVPAPAPVVEAAPVVEDQEPEHVAPRAVAPRADQPAVSRSAPVAPPAPAAPAAVPAPKPAPKPAPAPAPDPSTTCASGTEWDGERCVARQADEERIGRQYDDADGNVCTIVAVNPDRSECRPAA